ncbi:MAG: hypothetical protein QM535_18135 [Limnohabitans sp.]|nr:hypothetical protein [Limnohabitans sp.]
MTNNNETPKTWEQEKDLILLAQILTQSHQLTLILDNIHIMMKEIEKIQNTWEKVEKSIVHKQDI